MSNTGHKLDHELPQLYLRQAASRREVEAVIWGVIVITTALAALMGTGDGNSPRIA